MGRLGGGAAVCSFVAVAPSGFAARPRSLCRLVAAGCFLVAVLALSGVGAAFLSYHVLGPRVVRAYNIIVHDEL
mgnify:CR=1 FL=1